MLNGNEIVNLYRHTKNQFEIMVQSPDFTNELISRGIKWWKLDSDKNIDTANLFQAFKHISKRGAYVYWDSNIIKAAVSGHEAFVGRYIPAINPINQIWLFKDPNTMVADWMQHKEGYCELGRFIGQNHSGTIMFMHVCVNDRKPEIRTEDLALVPIAITSDYCIGKDNAVVSSFAACLEFMDQNFVEKTNLLKVAQFSSEPRDQSDKARAREIEIVYIRRREQHPTLQDGTPNPVDWSCQWLVKGHWRNQYHPGDKSHKPTFIQSYVKGPEDKPFKVPAQSIHAVVR